MQENKKMLVVFIVLVTTYLMIRIMGRWPWEGWLFGNIAPKSPEQQDAEDYGAPPLPKRS